MNSIAESARALSALLPTYISSYIVITGLTVKYHIAPILELQPFILFPHRESACGFSVTYLQSLKMYALFKVSYAVKL